MKKHTSSKSHPNREEKAFLYLTVFLAGAAVLVVEILGAKLLTPYFGTSHFVWTAQITMTLLALAVGYAVGGTMADWRPSPGGLYAALGVACVWLSGAALACEPVSYAVLRFGLSVGSLLASLLLFFVPLAALATVGPYAVKLLTTQLAHVGGRVGRLTALSTIGSVAGTLLIGYALLPYLENTHILLGTAGVLGVLVLIYGIFWARSGFGFLFLMLVLSLSFGWLSLRHPPLQPPPGLRELYRRNSNFGLLQVVETRDGRRRYYLNDLLIQDSWDPLTKKSQSMFTYMLHGLARVYAPQAKKVLCIGLGIGIVPRQFAAEGAQVDVVEINPAVVPVAERFFDFHPEQLHRLWFGDGRYYLESCTNRYEVIILDAFLGESPPSHLMTREAFTQARERLTEDGVLVINAFGELDPGRDFMTASLYWTLAEVFPTVRFYTSGNGNIFFVASPRKDRKPVQPMDWSGVPAELFAEVQAASVPRTPPARSHGMILTDAYNPADFYDAVNRMQLRRLLALSFRPELEAE